MNNQAANQRYNFSHWTEEVLANLKWQVDGSLFERDCQKIELWKKRFNVGDCVFVSFVDRTKAYGVILSVAVKSVLRNLKSDR